MAGLTRLAERSTVGEPSARRSSEPVPSASSKLSGTRVTTSRGCVSSANSSAIPVASSTPRCRCSAEWGRSTDTAITRYPLAARVRARFAAIALLPSFFDGGRDDQRVREIAPRAEEQVGAEHAVSLDDLGRDPTVHADVSHRGDDRETPQLLELGGHRVDAGRACHGRAARPPRQAGPRGARRPRSAMGGGICESSAGAQDRRWRDGRSPSSRCRARRPRVPSPRRLRVSRPRRPSTRLPTRRRARPPARSRAPTCGAPPSGCRSPPSRASGPASCARGARVSRRAPASAEARRGASPSRDSAMAGPARRRRPRPRTR